MSSNGLTLTPPSGFTPRMLAGLTVDKNSAYRSDVEEILSSFERGEVGKKNSIKDYTSQILRDGGSIKIVIYSESLLAQLQQLVRETSND